MLKGIAPVISPILLKAVQSGETAQYGNIILKKGNA